MVQQVTLKFQKGRANESGKFAVEVWPAKAISKMGLEFCIIFRCAS